MQVAAIGVFGVTHRLVNVVCSRSIGLKLASQFAQKSQLSLLLFK
jgi:hypothetical protein